MIMLTLIAIAVFAPARADIRAALAPVEHLVAIDDVLEVQPVGLHVVPGFETAVLPFTTDVPLLEAWGTPLLFGPGSILVAHTGDDQRRF